MEANRSPTNPRLWSSYTAGLSREAKADVCDRYYWPHRNAVVAAVEESLTQGARVVHVAVHSFTPVLRGEVRNADVGLLYDPTRRGERTFCLRWADLLRERVPGLRVRRNYPYLGVADGLPTWLRRRFPASDYRGMELEVGQALLASRRRDEVAAGVAETLATLIPPGAAAQRG